ncbi:MAG: hypothetical protein ABIQ96_23800 [Luteolibacter sp.]
MALLGFVAGWMCACIRLQRSFGESQVISQVGRDEEIKTLRQRIYGSNHYHQKWISPESDERLERLDFSQSGGSITLAYANGLSGRKSNLQIRCDGTFSINKDGVPRLITTLDSTRCADFFKRVITSGLLNYSDDVVEMKRDLKRPNPISDVSDASSVGFVISVPKLDIEKEFSIYAPEVELRNYPDIIEFQLIVAVEKDILNFIPKNDPYWK